MAERIEGRGVYKKPPGATRRVSAAGNVYYASKPATGGSPGPQPTAQTRRRSKNGKVYYKGNSRGADRPFKNVSYEEFPRDLDYLYVDYGTSHTWVKLLTLGMEPYEIQGILNSRRPRDCRTGSLEVKLRNLHDDDSKRTAGAVGAYIALQRTDQSIRPYIQDVRSLFMKPWPIIKEAYKTDDLADIMERTRSSLASTHYPLRPASMDSWWRLASIGKQLLKVYEINDLSIIPPQPVEGRIIKPIIRHGIYGHYGEPVWNYDLTHAYNYFMSLIPGLGDYCQHIWRARLELKGDPEKGIPKDPAEQVVKNLGAVLHGLFNSTVSGEQYYNPNLYRHVVSQCRSRVNRALQEVYKRGGIVVRVNTDGFIATVDITDFLATDGPGLGADLGQWKVSRHESITIAAPNLFFCDDKLFKTNGLKVGDREICEADILERPEGLLVSQEYVDWQGDLELKLREPYPIRQRHEHYLCPQGASWHYVNEEGRRQDEGY
jgi:hypothetical protein